MYILFYKVKRISTRKASTNYHASLVFKDHILHYLLLALPTYCRNIINEIFSGFTTILISTLFQLILWYLIINCVYIALIFNLIRFFFFVFYTYSKKMLVVNIFKMFYSKGFQKVSTIKGKRIYRLLTIGAKDKNQSAASSVSESRSICDTRNENFA